MLRDEVILTHNHKQPYLLVGPPCQAHELTLPTRQTNGERKRDLVGPTHCGPGRGEHLHRVACVKLDRRMRQRTDENRLAKPTRESETIAAGLLHEPLSVQGLPARSRTVGIDLVISPPRLLSWRLAHVHVVAAYPALVSGDLACSSSTCPRISSATRGPARRAAPGTLAGKGASTAAARALLGLQPEGRARGAELVHTGPPCGVCLAHFAAVCLWCLLAWSYPSPRRVDVLLGPSLVSHSGLPI